MNSTANYNILSPKDDTGKSNERSTKQKIRMNIEVSSFNYLGISK
jgi:hypothetical protein